MPQGRGCKNTIVKKRVERESVRERVCVRECERLRECVRESERAGEREPIIL